MHIPMALSWSLNGFLYQALGLSGSIESDTTVYILGSFVIFMVVLTTIMQTVNLKKTRKMLKEKQEAYDIIEQQKNKLELKNRGVTDSLVYAQRIQEAMLPSEFYLKEFFGDSFIFYKPKDIVSGDFYWIGEVGDNIFVVAADCTGHGVPGALLSMIGMEMLDKAINEVKIDRPDVILGVINDNLSKTFSRKKNVGSVIRDGMDIGVCVINKKAKTVDFSGALFPLYLIRDNNLVEYKGDRTVVGVNPEGYKYTVHHIDVEDDDVIYMFSDGYADQFGGQSNKKFMYRRFRYLLSTISRFPVETQKDILDDNIRTWMGNHPQIDDMMIIGLKPLSAKLL